MAITTHNGQRWNLAKPKPELPRYPWVFWTYQWQPQPSTEQSPFPDGSSGIHEVIVTVQ